ncbi:MAG: hypothetical protein JSS09_04130 [Verrucomicrobia bacterium]|nr:hypothetical protein [Verrucomicrobiota bacterium]
MDTELDSTSFYKQYNEHKKQVERYVNEMKELGNQRDAVRTISRHTTGETVYCPHEKTRFPSYCLYRDGVSRLYCTICNCIVVSKFGTVSSSVKIDPEQLKSIVALIEELETKETAIENEYRGVLDERLKFEREHKRIQEQYDEIKYKC